MKQPGTCSRMRGISALRSRRKSGLLIPVLLLALLAGQIVSCAYYNTFYSARKYYQQAMRAAQQQGKPGAQPGAAAAVVSGQTSALLDRAIEKCAKVISVYPKSKWVDDAILLLGECYYQKQDYDKAMRKFNELAMYYPKSSLIPRAQFLTGMSFFGIKQYDQASEVLSKFVAQNPHSEDRDAALYTLGEASFEQLEYADALPYYRNVAAKRQSTFRTRSLFKAGECYFEMAKYDSARTCFSTVAGTSSEDDRVLDALIKTGDCYSLEKNLDAATNTYGKALVLAKSFGKTSVVKLKMASVLVQKGDYKKAIELYQSVVDESPRTIQASEAQFRIGYVYEVNLDDLESASAAYGKVKEHASRSEFAALADLRSKGLAKLKEFSQTAQTSEGEKAAESAFLVAELNLFQMEKPDKAIEKYLSVEKDFPATSFAPKSAYAAAYVFLHMKQDTASAVETFERIVEHFPNSEYASAATEALAGLKGKRPQQASSGEAAPDTLGSEAH